MAFEFPQDFLWGTATAAHQVEGNNTHSDNWVLENTPGTNYVEPSGDACDHYHRYPEDIRLVADLGFNAYRFSIEWARVQPEPGWFSRAEIEHYRRMLGECVERGLKPVVTFHHFTSPRWLMAEGGWASHTTPDRFASYCERVTRDLGDLIAVGCTINEPNLSALFSQSPWFPSKDALSGTPFWQNAARALGTTPESLTPYLYASSEEGEAVKLAAHRRAIAAVKAAGGRFPLGMTLALQDFQAVDDTPETAEWMARLHQRVNDVYLEAVREGAAQGLDDFVGVQVYSRQWVGPQGMEEPPADAEKTQMGYEFYPEALERMIRRANHVAQVPVIVTENGLATADDARRVEYIRRAVNGAANCLRDGLPLKGYFYWSMMDNFEWNSGYQMTFGMVGVNRETQTRAPKPSARFLGAIAKQNRVDD